MNGPADVAERVAAHLAAHLPAKLAELEGRYELAAGDLKVPQRMPARDPKLAVDNFPAYTVGVLEAPTFRRVDVDDAGAAFYEVRYTLRPFIFARAKTEEAAGLLRDRYVLAVREILLSRPTIDPTQGPVVDESTWRESYSDTGRADQTKAIAAAFVEFAATMIERLADTNTPYTPTGIDVDVVTLPPGSPRTPPPGDLLPVPRIDVETAHHPAL